VPPTPTGDFDLHDIALENGLATNRSIYDTLYVAFAVSIDAPGVVVADGPFLRNMANPSASALARLLIPLADR
jgi:hypothetical protein